MSQPYKDILLEGSLVCAKPWTGKKKENEESEKRKRSESEVTKVVR